MYQFTLPFEPYRRTCTRFYGVSMYGRSPKYSSPHFSPLPSSRCVVGMEDRSPSPYILTYGRGRALKTAQFFLESTPHHDGPPFDPMPASDADPQASATAPHPAGDVTRVAAQSDSADGGSAGTIFGVVAICYKWGDVRNP